VTAAFAAFCDPTSPSATVALRAAEDDACGACGALGAKVLKYIKMRMCRRCGRLYERISQRMRRAAKRGDPMSATRAESAFDRVRHELRVEALRAAAELLGAAKMGRSTVWRDEPEIRGISLFDAVEQMDHVRALRRRLQRAARPHCAST